MGTLTNVRPPHPVPEASTSIPAVLSLRTGGFEAPKTDQQTL
jgi:hypothetical protein